MRFQNPNGLQRIPRSYFGTLPNGQSFRILWDNAIQSWESYYDGLRKTLESNGVSPIPSAEDVQDFMCQHVTQGCVGQPPDELPRQAVQPSGGCASCGGPRF